MIEIHLQAVNVHVAELPDGVKIVKFEDPQSGIAVVVPMPMLAAIQMANALSGKTLVIPDSLPPGMTQ
jgi:hypothetical protein